MRKHVIAFFVGLFILLIVGALGWLAFSKKKTVDLDIERPISEIIQEEKDIEQIVESKNMVEENSQKEIEIVEEQVKEKEAEEKSAAKEDKNESKNNSEDDLEIINKLVTWGFEKGSGREIDTIVIHSSYDAVGKDPYSIDGIIAEYKEYGVSAHYLIGRDGKTYRLVENKNIAYHAGVSKVPDGRTGVNAFSIGIEIVNTQDGKFTDAQYSALNSLIKDLKKQYSIKYILGHKDIAPDRKTDPWNIDWTKIQK